MKKMLREYRADEETTAGGTGHDGLVGARIRALRKKNAVTLQALSRRTGLSIGYLSQIERGISSASVRALVVIAGGLGVGFDQIFMQAGALAPGAGPAAFAYRISERKSLGFWRDGIEKDLLTPGEGLGLNLYLVHLAAGGCSGEAAYSHDGVEAGFVIDGRFELTVDETTRTMNAGDAFRFRSNRPHRWRNITDAPCTILWVLTP